MANKEHVKLIKKSIEEWNGWRKKHPEERPDLRDADLSGADLSGANLFNTDLSGANLYKAYLYKASLWEADLKEARLSGADLYKANLYNAFLVGANFSEVDLRGTYLFEANLSRANLYKANLRDAILVRANLYKANLSEADLGRANLFEANLSEANLSEADLSGANLYNTDLSDAKLPNASIERASLVETNLKKADLKNCRIYGISVWNVKLDKATIQSDLIITKKEEPIITVDNLEVAQFIYLLLNNQKIRHVIDTITSKVVLILGRFTPKRKAILDAIRNELRKHDYLPVLFDFEKPSSRNTQETVTILARLARFVIADVTSPKSIPQELVGIVESLPSLPVQPILTHGSKPWDMYDHIKSYPWVLKIHKYKNQKDLLPSLWEKVINPAEEMLLEAKK